MLLFLDVISSIPEFFIIEDNKVIYQRKIITNVSDKLSDNIFENYTEINNNFNLTDNLKKIAITIGPGSYTSLRVGAAFISGLQISKNLEFYPLSITDIYKFKLKTYKEEDLGFFICSSKNQNFFCTMSNQQNIEYTKIEDDTYLVADNITKIFYNYRQFDTTKKVKQYKFSFIEEILMNYNTIEFLKNTIINPIYVSNNKILN